MKKLIFGLFFLVLALGIQAQGLEKIYVETYYVSNSTDNGSPDGTLPAGSITYRFYVDMQPGWGVSSVYGSADQPLFFTSANSLIWNNGNNGTSIPTQNLAKTKANTQMLDSWVTCGGTVGTSGAYYLGIPKHLDDNVTNAANTFNNGSYLQNAIVPSKKYDYALTTNDGMIAGTVEECKTIGISTELGILADATTSGNFRINSAIGGAWGPLNPVQGTTSDNMVLIAQITVQNNAGSDATLEYELNVQIRNIATDELERYSNNPIAGDMPVNPNYKLHGMLNAAVILPTASITAPAASAVYTEPAVVTINANAVAGTNPIQKVEFLVDGIEVGEDIDSPYTYAWTSAAKTGTTNLTVRAVDSDNNVGVESAIVGITVNGNAAPLVSGLSATPSPIYVADALTLKATVTDDAAVASVVFKVDGTVVPGAVAQSGNDYSIAYTVAGLKGNRAWSVEATDNGTPAKTTIANGTFVVSNKLPTISIAPVAGFTIIAGNDTTFVATVSDADGSVSKVDFTIDGITVSDNATPFEFTYVAVGSGSKTLAAVVTDDNNSSSSANIIFNVTPPSGKDYELGILSELCSSSDVFCMPIKAAKAVSNVIGYDITLNFDHTKVNPNGIINVAEGSAAFVSDRDYTSYNVHLYPGTDSMKISLWLNTTAPAGTKFAGDAGDVLACIEFSRMPNFGSQASTTFSAPTLQESYENGYTMNGATPGSYSTHRESDFAGSLSFWSDNSPIRYTPTLNLITNISGDKNPAVKVQPDASGNFIYNINNGSKMTIARDIPNDVRMDTIQQIIGGLDAYYTAKVTVDDAGYKPNVYQLIAMDVNRDGRVTAGDITQIQQRSVLNIGQFTQAGSTNLDWVFVPSQTVLTDVSYRISPNYPYASSYGYYKNAVPAVPVVKDLVALQTVVYTVFGNDTCTSVTTENYKGILLGDVTGNYASMPSSPRLKSGKAAAAKFVLDIRNIGENEYDVVISAENVNDIKGYDVNFESSKFVEIISSTDYASMNMARNLVNNQVGVTGYTLGNFANGSLASIVLKTNGTISASDIRVNLSTINESSVNYELKETSALGIHDLTEGEVSIYPNPASDILNIAVVEKSTILLLDVYGKVVMEVVANANEVKTLDVSNLAAGTYVVKVVSESKVTSSKILVQN